ncbi:MAG: hypothetical protein ACI8P0_000420 [Planctomycetaceae bacterium]|jgi:hypothetical protein
MSKLEISTIEEGGENRREEFLREATGGRKLSVGEANSVPV